MQHRAGGAGATSQAKKQPSRARMSIVGPLLFLLVAIALGIGLGPTLLKKMHHGSTATHSESTTPLPNLPSSPTPSSTSSSSARSCRAAEHCTPDTPSPYPSTTSEHSPRPSPHHPSAASSLSKRQAPHPPSSQPSASPASLLRPSPRLANMTAPNEKQTNTQIKEELRSLYAVTDFADCIEPGDLQKKLQATRDAVPMTHGLRYGTLLEIGNKRNPTGVVTLSHGLGDSAYGWEDVGRELAHRLPYLLFLLPSAPSRSVTINGGMSMPAWYDIFGMIGESLRSGRQDAAAIYQSCDYVRSLAHIAAKKYSMNPHRVVYGGFSQGAAVALTAGLTARVAPAGIACMSGYFAASTDTMPRILNKAVPITMFHGRQDPVVPIVAARESKEMLEKEGGVQTIDFLEYNMPHSAVPQEINDLAAFLSRVLPEKF